MFVLFIICIFIQLCAKAFEDNQYRIPSQQLAFGIMIYQKQHLSIQDVLEDFHKLMEDIYSVHNHLYVIHVDIKSSDLLIKRYMYIVFYTLLLFKTICIAFILIFVIQNRIVLL